MVKKRLDETTRLEFKRLVLNTDRSSRLTRFSQQKDSSAEQKYGYACHFSNISRLGKIFVNLPFRGLGLDWSILERDWDYSRHSKELEDCWFNC